MNIGTPEIYEPDPPEASRSLQAEQAHRAGVAIAKIRMLCKHCEVAWYGVDKSRCYVCEESGVDLFKYIRNNKSEDFTALLF